MAARPHSLGMEAVQAAPGAGGQPTAMKSMAPIQRDSEKTKTEARLPKTTKPGHSRANTWTWYLPPQTATQEASLEPEAPGQLSTPPRTAPRLLSTALTLPVMAAVPGPGSEPSRGLTEDTC